MVAAHVCNSLAACNKGDENVGNGKYKSFAHRLIVYFELEFANPFVRVTTSSRTSFDVAPKYRRQTADRPFITRM